MSVFETGIEISKGSVVTNWYSKKRYCYLNVNVNFKYMYIIFYNPEDTELTKAGITILT